MNLNGFNPGIETLAVIAAVALFLVIVAVVSVLRGLTNKSEKAVRDRLNALAMAHPGAQAVDIVRRESMSDVPWMNRALAKLAWARNFSKTLKQADAKGTPGMYLLLMALLAVCGFYLSFLLLNKPLLIILSTLLPAYVPLWRVKRRKNKRMGRFQAQLPEALDLVSRAMRAGHTFAGGLRMVVDEFDDPIASEFGIVMDEINFGVGLEEALGNLLNRVDCADLKFFVVSVVVQRETGGNLAEIIGNIARLVRERFKLMGRVRVLSAEGRMSAMVLLILPFAIAGVLTLLNPDYMSTLIEHEYGTYMIQGALFQMGLGVVVIKRMIKIKV